MEQQTSIILPNHTKTIIQDTTAYWAAFYCSILKTVRYQKNLDHVWGNNKSLKDYRGELRISGFFHRMRGKVQNHSFEYVMVDFLKTKTGIKIFKELCYKILSDYEIKDFNIELMNIFKVGNDTDIFNAKEEYNKDIVKMLLPKGIIALPKSVIPGYNLSGTLKYSDLLILISNGEETIGFVGEVEGVHGEGLFQKSYFTKNPTKDKYCTFCIGVSDKKKHGSTMIKDLITLNKDESIGRWTLHFSKSNSYIADYITAIENIQNLIDGHFGYMESIPDLGHKKIIDLIKNYWGKDIIELISSLESLVEYVVSTNTFHYQEYNNGVLFYRPSPLSLPDQLPLYSINDE